MDWQLLIAIAVATTLAAVLQGLTGFGYSLLLGAVLMAFRHQLGLEVTTIVLLANITTLFSQAAIMYRLRGKTALRAVWSLLAGIAVTVPAGLWLVTIYGRQPWLVRLFGAFVAAVAVWLLLAPKRPAVTARPRRLLGFVTGLVTGLFSGMFNTGGPTTVLYTYTRPIPLESAKATVQWVFTGGSLYRLALTAAALMIGLMPPAGRPDLSIALHGLLVLPLVVGGALAGMALAGYVHPERMRKAVFVLLIVFGLKAVIWP